MKFEKVRLKKNINTGCTEVISDPMPIYLTYECGKWQLMNGISFTEDKIEKNSDGKGTDSFETIPIKKDYEDEFHDEVKKDRYTYNMLIEYAIQNLILYRVAECDSIYSIGICHALKMATRIMIDDAFNGKYVFSKEDSDKYKHIKRCENVLLRAIHRYCINNNYITCNTSFLIGFWFNRTNNHIRVEILKEFRNKFFLDKL